MKKVIIAALLSLAATGAVSAQAVTDLGGGFAYQPVGSGQCQVLLDAKSGQPILQTSMREPSRVVLVGENKECPKEYNELKVTRVARGSSSGYIYYGFADNGRRLYIYRRIGSDFTFRFGPRPKK